DDGHPQRGGEGGGASPGVLNEEPGAYMRRRSLFTLGIFSSLATLSLGAGLTACEDGPNQTFSPASANAGNFWNNGNPDASVGGGSTPLDGSPAVNITPLNLCSPDLQRAKWAEMLTQPIF